MAYWLEQVKNTARKTSPLFEAVGEMGMFGIRAIRETVKPPFEMKEICSQLFEIGWRSCPLIISSGIAIGIVMSLHTRSDLVRFGAESMIPAVVALGRLRDLGPLTAGLLISGRVGAGIGAELAEMCVTEQIDALDSLAIDSFKYLVVTRIVACMIALPVLTAIMNFAVLFGGFISEHVASGMSLHLYFQHAFDLVSGRILFLPL